MQRTALVLGASGLVGGQLVAQLLADPAYGAVQRVVRFNALEQEQRSDGVDDGPEHALERERFVAGISGEQKDFSASGRILFLLDVFRMYQFGR